MQGGYADEIVEEAEADMSANTAAAVKEREPAKRMPKERAPEETVAPPSVSEPEPKPQYTGEPAREPVRRPVPPPVEEPQKEEKHVGGFNLSTLLDDIRSIGSNI